MMDRGQADRFVAFTLIELLIVVAIIAILAAIAVPNFLEAQTRSKVSRVKSDLRTLATGLESYRVDSNHYPMNLVKTASTQWYQATKNSLTVLTTPVAYLASVGFEDPFQPVSVETVDPWSHKGSRSYLYMSYEATPSEALASGIAQNWIDAESGRQYATSSYCLLSWGPNRTNDQAEWTYWYLHGPAIDRAAASKLLYDPTNGTVSPGDIVRFGGGTAGLVN
jgi:prepilin-type N-terminal cleavage/methylation domain-containing protein